ncbi:MAG: hypothetical protein ACYC27_11860 [Armatimonadota bacterium]
MRRLLVYLLLSMMIFAVACPIMGAPPKAKKVTPLPAMPDKVAIDCTSLQEETIYSRWFTAPHSRIVINPNVPVRIPFTADLMPSLPMNIAYYAGENPVKLPYLWAWQPGGSASVRSTVTPGPSAVYDGSSGFWRHDGITANYNRSSVDVKVAEGHGFGALTGQVTIDLDQTPYLFVHVPRTDQYWVVKVNAGGDLADTYLIRDTSETGSFMVDVRTATGWSGTKTFQLRLFSCGKPGSSTMFSTVRFAGVNSSVPVFTSSKTTWAPHQMVTQAESSKPIVKVDASTCFADESTISQLLKIKQAPNGSIALVGQFNEGNIRWDSARRAVILQGDKFHAAISISKPCKWLGVYPSWSDWLTGDAAQGPSSGVWAVSLDGIKAGDEIVVSARFSPSASGVEETINAASKYASPASFKDTVSKREMDWNHRFDSVPHPHDFRLRTVDPKGTTPDQIRRMYYKAWSFILSDILPPMPENGYPYPQFACGKASLWGEGHPKARASSQWESFIAMQFGALVGPDTAWSAFEGMMSLVDEKGEFGGEGLPSRHAQTAWILYSQSGNKEKLKSTYPALKRLLVWKASDPRWIFHESTPPTMRDSEFVVHVLMDMTYAVRIAKVLGMTDEETYWKSEIKRITADFYKWFWTSPDAAPNRIYYTSNGVREEHGGTWCLQGLVLPPDILDQPHKDSLLRLLHSCFRDDVPFLIYGLNKHPTYNFAMIGAWQYGKPEEAAKMAEAVMRDVTLANEFTEGYSADYPVKGLGVTPSVFGAANILDAALWHNGIIMGDGLSVIAHLPNAVGVDNLAINGRTVDIMWDNIGSGVRIWGKGLDGLNLPSGLESSPMPDKTPLWKGKLEIGSQIRLETK